MAIWVCGATLKKAILAIHILGLTWLVSGIRIKRVGWWKNGYPEYFGKVINATNFIPVELMVNDHKVDLAIDEVKDYEIELDMKTGILKRAYTWINGQQEVRFTFKRYVSVALKELAVIEVTAEVLKGNATIVFTPKMDGNMVNEDSNYDEKFWLEMNRISGKKVV